MMRSISRRQFIGQQMFAAAGVGWGVKQLRADPPRFRPDRGRGWSAVVIGAGLAGLAAAQSLLANGFSVTVLEARKSAGGRAATDHSLGFAAELGASVIQGSEANPLSKLAQAAQLQTSVLRPEAALYYQQPDRPLDAPYVQQVQQNLRNILGQLNNQTPTVGSMSTMESVLTEMLNSISSEQRPSTRWQLFAELELRYGDELQMLSINQASRQSTFAGPSIVLPVGMNKLIESQTKGLTILYDQQVRVIDSTNQMVIVTNQRGQRHTANFCVCTIPLGVLKSGAVKFLPELPRVKREAMNRLNTGSLHQAVLLFDKPFWNPQAQCFASLTAPHTEFRSLLPTHDVPALLMRTVGKDALLLEQLNEQAIKNEALVRLRRCFAQRNAIPEPRGVISSRWASDPLAQGSCSSPGVGFEPVNFDQLAAPMLDRLYFAGEATAREQIGTMHGAWLSGERAVGEIVKRLGG